MRRLSFLIATMLWAGALATTSADAKRVALVIGINTYDNLRPDQQLRKAVNDARAVGGALKDAGFQVIAAEDATRSTFLRTWQRFLDSIEPGDVTAIFFAGHGIELNGVNFLLTRDVPRADDGEEVMRGSAIRVASLMERLREQNPQVAVWIIDACRDSPYAGPGVTRSVGSTRGLKREEPPKGTLVMMSAGTGQGALDALSPADAHPNSVYTRTLLPLLKEPGLEITDLAKRVRSQVEMLASTIRHDQRPAFYHELSGNFFLMPPGVANAPAAPASPGMSEAAQAWMAAKDSTNPALLDAFIRQFSGTFYAGMAQARLDELKTSPRPAAPAGVALAPAAAPPPAIQRTPPPQMAAPPPRAAPAPTPAPSKPPTAMESAQAWVAVKDSTNVATLEQFLGRHGDSIYAGTARDRLETAKRQQVAAAPSAPPSPSQSPLARVPPEGPLPPGGTPAPAPRPSASESAQAWLSVKDATDAAPLEAFLQRHGDSIYIGQARAKLEELKREDGRRSQVAVVAPPAPRPPAPAVITPAVGVSPPAPLNAAQERSLKPKDTFQECAHCPEMVVMPSGSFTMGSPDSETGRASNEGPQRTVVITKPFTVGKFAVTFDEWEACVTAGGCNAYRPADEGGRRGSHPVVNVSWEDAKAYGAWLAKATGKPYRLLSEAEREYVARAGTATPFWFGATISAKQANYDGSAVYGAGEKGEFRRRSLPVDFFAPNPFGLHQVHGNVYEWVEDCLTSYQDAPKDGTASTPGDCARRVLRGGSWYDGPQALRAAARISFYPGYRSSRIGFRVARSL